MARALEAPDRPRLTEIADSLSDISKISNIDVWIQGGAVRLRLYSDGMFRASRAELSRGARDTLGALSKRLRMIAPGHIHIEGHVADVPTNTPQYPNNWYLSSARAIAVGMYLIDEAGFTAKEISAQGCGPSAPIADNEDNKNNRIEIIVTP